MNQSTFPEGSLFPEFERFVKENDLLNRLKSGALGPRIHRIIGQGTTRASGIDLPPAPIERKKELIGLILPPEIALPDAVQAEIAQVRQDVDVFLGELRKPEGVRRLAAQVLRELERQGVATGYRDNCFYAEKLILVPRGRGEIWSWSLTRHYSIVGNLPPDPSYLVQGFEAARKRLKELLVPVEDFDSKLVLAWELAKHFSREGEVFLVDVARLFKVAGQSDLFWKTPMKRLFRDLPDACFLANLLAWRRYKGPGKTRFEFVQATLHQAHGPGARVFFMPTNDEGTQTNPVVYIRKVA